MIRQSLHPQTVAMSERISEDETGKTYEHVSCELPELTKEAMAHHLLQEAIHQLQKEVSKDKIAWVRVGCRITVEAAVDAGAWRDSRTEQQDEMRDLNDRAKSAITFIEEKFREELPE